MIAIIGVLLTIFFGWMVVALIFGWLSGAPWAKGTMFVILLPVATCSAALSIDGHQHDPIVSIPPGTWMLALPLGLAAAWLLAGLRLRRK
jgi:hypothetical protein